MSGGSLALKVTARGTGRLELHSPPDTSEAIAMAIDVAVIGSDGNQPSKLGLRYADQDLVLVRR